MITQTNHRMGLTLFRVFAVLAIVAILAVTRLPVLARAMDKSKTATCQGNLKQIGTAFMMYVHDYDEKNLVSLEEQWPRLLKPYMKNPQALTCPTDDRAGGRTLPGALDTSYGFVMGSGQLIPPWSGYKSLASRPLAEFAKPAKTLTAADNTRKDEGMSCGYIYIASKGGESAFTGFPEGDFAARHYGGTNVLFLDGHIKWIETKILKAGIDNKTYLYE